VFSSSRRHTSFSRDWSSDVCSSDLDAVERPERLALGPPPVARRGLGQCRFCCDGNEDPPVTIGGGNAIERGADERHGAGPAGRRSEERRVGKGGAAGGGGGREEEPR